MGAPIQVEIKDSCSSDAAFVKEDGTSLAGLAATATGVMMAAWYETGNLQKTLRADVNGALIVTGSVVVNPGVPVEDHDKTDPFDSTHDASVTVAPTIDYELNHVFVRGSGLDAGSTMTLVITINFTDPDYDTVVYTVVAPVDANGDASIAWCSEFFFPANVVAITVDVATSSVGSGICGITVGTDQ